MSLNRVISTRNYTGIHKVHVVASKGFNLQTDAYAKARPGYPTPLVEKIKSLITSKNNRVVDLAAGTGLMTKHLVNAGLHVTAVEPAENMRRKLNEVLPLVPCLPGTSWDIPLEDESLDAVVIAQAFHWFDDIQTLRELHRVLKQNGYGILAWNLESHRSDWIRKFRNEYEVYDKDVPQFRKMKWRKVFESKEADLLFKLPFQEVKFENDIHVYKPDIWKRVLSKSYIACLDSKEQQRLEERIESILKQVPVDDQNRVLIPHDSFLVYFEKKKHN
ncbi:hypothetical protein HPULCUR_008813 [Helicostylum pulchrum]|uniref:Methyltransferase type 11 domain-containing protein n=1 Tax=Helicostylum pulchrum TaxID=562976 RepID=A0ABP9Y8N2_9FUNG